jgi:hypothetical protein
MTEYSGSPLIGVPDSDSVYPLEKAIYKACPILAKHRIKIYGWVDPGVGYSSSARSNLPNSYYVVPRHLVLDQLILRVEREPDTVQTEHKDWGFRATALYGIDYRWTTAKGWGPASNELLNRNDEYGFDPVELYGLLYFPKVAQGCMVKFGRYISPPDIEAQLAPDNFLWTHSMMFTYDAYTHTGVQTTFKLSDQWMYQCGIHAGTDTAPWARGAIPTAETFLRWVSKNNNESIYGGIDAINGGNYGGLSGVSAQKDNLQQMNITWSHRFNRRVNTMTEGYFLYTFDALAGGTVSNGPVRSFGGGGGPGAYLPGMSRAYGLVNYTNIKITDRDYISIRPVDYLFDERGWRTGFATTYASWTIGWCHRFSDLLCIRPEIRYDRALNGHVNPFDNGSPADPKRYQFTFGFDLIQRF